MTKRTEQDGTDPKVRPSQTVSGKPLSDAARRALDEAEARRAAADVAEADLPSEVGGRAGPEPTRFGDWEKKGIVSDF